jgi:hypothetical protein
VSKNALKRDAFNQIYKRMYVLVISLLIRSVLKRLTKVQIDSSTDT